MLNVTDFSFLEGKWTVTNRRLKERLVNCDDWIEFKLNYEFQSLMGGITNIDRMFGDVNGEYFEGVSIRTYNPERNEWTIYWTDINVPDLTENVRGRFINGTGIFYGLEVHKGSRYLMRFLWKSLSAETARWEQAYYDPTSNNWETNWTMDFNRAV